LKRMFLEEAEFDARTTDEGRVTTAG
jgi:hypothetical protein